MASLRLHFFACLTVLCTFIWDVSANCYYPNGTDLETGRPANKTANLYSPCNAKASNSMCCAWEHIGSDFLNGKSGVTCRSDGLCGSEDGQAIWRTSCTDPTWQAPECIKLCANTTTQLSHHTQVTPCDDGSYCCGGDDAAQSCCQHGQGLFVQNGAVTSTNARASAAASSAVPSSATSTATALAISTSPTPQPKDPTKATHTGAIVGGVVGAITALLALAGLALYLFFKKMRMADSTPSNRGSKWKFGSIGSDLVEADAGNTQKFEIPGTNVRRAELRQPSPPPTELDVIPR